MEEIRLTVETQAGMTVIRIFKDRRSPTSYKEYTLSILNQEAEQRFTIPAPDDQLQNIFNAVRNARIAPMVEDEFRLHQDRYELCFNSSTKEKSYEWFCSAPQGWEPLGEIALLLLGFAMRYAGGFFL